MMSCKYDMCVKLPLLSVMITRIKCGAMLYCWMLEMLQGHECMVRMESIGWGTTQTFVKIGKPVVLYPMKLEPPKKGSSSGDTNESLQVRLIYS